MTTSTLACRRSLSVLAIGIAGCGSLPPFPLRAPLLRDSDMQDVSLACRPKPTEKNPHHLTCAPEPYVSPLVWDGADNLVFRPLAESFAFAAVHESVDVNSLDEVPDSSWFTNRVGARPLTLEELRLGACGKDQLLDPTTAAEGTWVIDKGKGDGSSPGFRVSVPGKGKYMFKAEPAEQPEHPSAASVVGAAIYSAAGYNTSCEQIVYFNPSLLKLTPGLRTKANFSDPKDFDRAALDKILKGVPRRNGLLRMQASAWLPGFLIGPFRYKGTRDDDPNDVVPHENRRELRGARLLAAWIDHFDAREQNTMDSWIAGRPGDPEGSPGHVLHHYLDTSDALGSLWDWEEISRRLGYSYIVDWGDLGTDFVTLGIPTRPWDRVKKVPGREMFAYFDVANFVPDEWKNEYPNPAFSRMTERDGAWMARVLSHFTPEMVATLARMADFSDPGNTDYLAQVLEGRLDRILQRYLTRLSPIADLRFEGLDRLCGVDLAERRGVREPSMFHPSASWSRGGPLAVEHGPEATVCVTLPHVAPDGGPADDAPERRAALTLVDGVAAGPLVANLYDLGPARGYRLAGLERPAP